MRGNPHVRFLEGPGPATAPAYSTLPTTVSPGLQPRFTVLDCANGQGACSAAAALTWQRLEYDGLGRQTTERVRYPATSGIVERARVTTYNALGWRLSQSAWGDTTKKTLFENHDPFGRPGRITPPGQPPTWLSYQGERVKTRETRVMLEGAGSPQPVFTTETYDARGRLVEVCEDRRSAWAGNCSDGLLTSYRYDVGNRLDRVCGNEVNGNCGQLRRFIYDHRGFLSQERHPETGPTGDGWIFYQYDARGNVRSKDVANTTLFDLLYTYDAAGRLIRVEEARGGNPRVLKEYFYAKNNSGADRRAGKLVQTRRHNWVQIVGPLRSGEDLDAVITESFQYQGKDGRVSSKRTTYSLNGGAFAFDFSQSYDDLGNVATLTYPQCLHSQGSCPQAAPARTVTNTYLKGFLRSVPGYAGQISYQAGGMLHEIEHANGVTYTIEIDPATGLERPHRIHTSAGWDTGIYSYDGVGNISQIGSQVFRYDGLSRLVRGQVDAGGVIKEQRASYDVYGNITQLVTDGEAQSTPTNAATNRLQGPLASYDAGGNVTSLHFGSESYEYTYDATNMMKHLQTNTDLSRVFLYNADDERIATFECPAGVCETRGALETWTLRGFDDQVLRIYEHPWNEGWQWKEDYIYREKQIISRAFEDNSESSAIEQVHLDHTQSPRQTTSESGTLACSETFFPFGSTESASACLGRKINFSSQEADDFDSVLQPSLSYMHARYFSSSLGRFLSVEPKIPRRAQPSSRRWNNYSYAANNPMKFSDPDGRDLKIVFDFSKSNLSDLQQTKVAVGIRQRFINAGVKKVEIFFPGGSRKAVSQKPTDRVVKLLFQSKPLEASPTALGSTSKYPGNTSFVTTANSPSEDPARLNQLINTGAHEVGHATGALQQYANDSMPLNSPLFPENAEEGTIMEQGPSAETLGEGVREFSAEDAEALRNALNDPGKE